MKPVYKLLFVALLLFLGTFWVVKKLNFNTAHNVGDVLDNFNGVKVYFNSGVGNVVGRNTADGYNIGLKYQCVEFVKRYYYEFYKHKMPNAFGHAKDFFNPTIQDGAINTDRALFQFTNPSSTPPKEGDLLIFDGTFSNKYGHVAIVSGLFAKEIEIVQQNPGHFGKSREKYALAQINGKWLLDSHRILGWLRK